MKKRKDENLNINFQILPLIYSVDYCVKQNCDNGLLHTRNAIKSYDYKDLRLLEQFSITSPPPLAFFLLSLFFIKHNFQKFPQNTT